MVIVMVALAASALLGLATGLGFRVWANLIVAPVVAFGSATALVSHGLRYFDGMLVSLACLFVSQTAYLIGVFLAPDSHITTLLADDVCDDEPRPIASTISGASKRSPSM